MTKQLGTRAEAQQRVLAEGNVASFTSWRDVDARIKEVEQDIIAERQKQV